MKNRLTDNFEKLSVTAIFENAAVAVSVSNEEDLRVRGHSHFCGLAEVVVIRAGNEGLAQNQIGLGGAFGKPQDLMKTDIGDVDVALGVDCDAMGHVEHVGAEGGNFLEQKIVSEMKLGTFGSNLGIVRIQGDNHWLRDWSFVDNSILLVKRSKKGIHKS